MGNLRLLRLALFSFTVILICSCDKGNQNYLAALDQSRDINATTPSLDNLFTRINNTIDSAPALALQYSHQSRSLATRIGDSLSIVKAYRLTAEVYRQLHQPDSAIYFYKCALAIAERNSFDERKFIYDGLGSAYTFSGIYDQGLRHYFLALNFSRQLADTAYMSVVQNNIGLLHYNVGNNEKALEYFIEALKNKQKKNAGFDIELLLVKTGLCYRKLGNYERALRYIDQAIKVCGEDCDGIMKANADLAYGLIFSKMEKWEKAKKYLVASYQKAIQIADTSLLTESQFGLGALYLRNGELAEAKTYLLRALEFARKTEHSSLAIDCYNELISLYSKENDLNERWSMQQALLSLRDSFYPNQRANKLASLEVEYQRKNDEILISQKEELVSQETTKVFLYSVIVLLLIVIVFALLSIIRNKRRIQKHLDLKLYERLHELNEAQGNYQRDSLSQNLLFIRTFNELEEPVLKIKRFSDRVYRTYGDDRVRKHVVQTQRAIASLLAVIKKVSLYNFN
jgi:tetratricopeptide (TPR) repeat protein